jgi:hypothetical protein
MIALNFSVDFDAISELAGAIAGLSDSWNDAAYLDALARDAHSTASLAFDAAAAASASAGYLTHMYEFGVNGITRGPSRIADPTSPIARLWNHQLNGSKGVYNIEYSFRPAIQPNPLPTTADTGVPSKYLRKISRRKYIFKNKAMVTETGMEVTIAPKKGRLLFVPFYGEPANGGRGRSDRGYMMNPHTMSVIPGRTSAGTFTTFWEGWWNGTGKGIMEKEIQKKIAIDVETALNTAAAKSKRITPRPAKTAAAGMAASAAAAKTRTSNSIKAAATARGGKERK